MTNEQKYNKLKEAAKSLCIEFNYHENDEDITRAFIQGAKSEAAKLYHGKEVDLTELKEKIKFYISTETYISERHGEYSVKGSDDATDKIMKLISPYLQQPAKSDAVEFGKWLLLNYGDINGLNIDVLYNEYYLPENNTNPISKH